jgi:hypothetical protein
MEMVSSPHSGRRIPAAFHYRIYYDFSRIPLQLRLDFFQVFWGVDLDNLANLLCLWG